jgi:hypothetical protein
MKPRFRVANRLIVDTIRAGAFRAEENPMKTLLAALSVLVLVPAAFADECVDIETAVFAKAGGDCNTPSTDGFVTSKTAICRKEIGGKSERRTTWCGKGSSYEDCLANSMESPDMKTLKSCHGGGVKAEDVKALIDAWAKGTCFASVSYGKKNEASTPEQGAEKKDGCHLGKIVVPAYTYVLGKFPNPLLKKEWASSEEANESSDSQKTVGEGKKPLSGDGTNTAKIPGATTKKKKVISTVKPGVTDSAGSLKTDQSQKNAPAN